jgi:hypothetical protein
VATGVAGLVVCDATTQPARAVVAELVAKLAGRALIRRRGLGACQDVAVSLSEQVRVELERFARRARKLSAVRLEQSGAGLLTLFEGGDPHVSTQRIERILRAAVEDIHDPVDRRVAEALLASEAEFFDKTVSERRAFVATHDVGFTDEQYKTRRARIVAELADVLTRRMGAGQTQSVELLTVEARTSLRNMMSRLARGAVLVEAFDFVSRVRENLPSGQYREHVDALYFARSAWSDETLWVMSQLYRNLHNVLDDPTGRDYLDDTLSPGWEHRHNLYTPFAAWEIQELRSVGKAEPADFVDTVLKGRFGADVHQRWLRTLTTAYLPDHESDSKYRRNRRELLRAITSVLEPLAQDFPGDNPSLGRLEVDFDWAVWRMVLFAPCDAGAPFGDEEAHELYRAYRRALDQGPQLWAVPGRSEVPPLGS